VTRIAPAADLSLRHEAQRAIDRGLAALLSRQDPAGWWSSPDHPALTALALTAFMGDPSGRYRTNPHPALARAWGFLRASAQPDGGIHRGALPNYNTAISATALALANQPGDEDLLRRARAYLVRSQNDFGEPGRLDTPLDGGVGYGDRNAHSDLNNTLVALEALRATEHLDRDRPASERADLNWDAAIRFIQTCQNLPTHNREPWVSTDPQDRGGFVYYPGHSMAGGETNVATGKIALRSYGTISYAGLLSYLYARLDRNDPRVTAVIAWLRNNYTLDENPGMGAQGLYYYFHLQAKALQALGTETLEVQGKRRIAWRRELVLRLINLQQSDGSWSNDNNRWWEKDPCLVTAYTVSALNLACQGL